MNYDIDPWYIIALLHRLTRGSNAYACHIIGFDIQATEKGKHAQKEMNIKYKYDELTSMQQVEK